MKKTITIIALVGLALAVGCESEIDDKPAALVSEAEASEQAEVDEVDDTVETRTLAIDSQKSSIGWVGAKVTGDHTGGFNEWSGTVEERGGELRRLNFTVDTRSIFSDNDRLTGHLKSDDFFDVETYPEASFTSTRIAKSEAEGATHEITGNFTIRGVTHGVTFPATVEIGETLKANTEFTIDRFDFGIEFAGQPDDLIRKEVLLKIALETS